MSKNEFYQVAIDGPAASGKSTAAKLLAKQIHGYYINTGDMYRTISWAIMKNNVDPVHCPDQVLPLLNVWDMHYRIVDNLPQLFFNDVPVLQKDIRTPEVASIVSYVAKIPEVRTWMIDRQRECCALGNIIMEGRDIATVILPKASYKFFITASPEARAKRRFAQSEEVAKDATLAKIAHEIAERDRIDSTRKIAPLKPAEDSVILITDELSKQQVVDKMLQYIHA